MKISAKVSGTLCKATRVAMCFPPSFFSDKILEVPHTAKSVLIFLPCLAKILLLNDKYTILQLSLNCVAHPHQSVAWQLPFTDGVICIVAHISILNSSALWG